MFGILQKMDRFSNNLMDIDEKISFLQEIIDNEMIFDMHHKYQNAALSLIEQGKLSCAVMRRFKNYCAVTASEPLLDADGRDPFDVSICY